jgi:hypothetical protein
MTRAGEEAGDASFGDQAAGVALPEIVGVSPPDRTEDAAPGCMQTMSGRLTWLMGAAGRVESAASEPDGLNLCACCSW